MLWLLAQKETERLGNPFPFLTLLTRETFGYNHMSFRRFHPPSVVTAWNCPPSESKQRSIIYTPAQFVTRALIAMILKLLGQAGQQGREAMQRADKCKCSLAKYSSESSCSAFKCRVKIFTAWASSDNLFAREPWCLKTYRKTIVQWTKRAT